VNELAGMGNHNTALFWEYDTRTGRRWNRDPVDKVWESDYSSFSNNPLIFIDPNGDTDFFNTDGNKIGTDGVSNGIKLLVVHKQTSKTIEKQMQKNNKATLTERQMLNTHLVPNKETLNKFDEIFNKTSGGVGEYGLIAGTDNNNAQVSSSIYAGDPPTKAGDIPSVKHGKGVREFKGALKGVNAYVVHSHPYVVKMKEKGVNYVTGSANPSQADLDFVSGSAYANVLLAHTPEKEIEGIGDISKEDRASADAAEGVYVPRTGKSVEKITIYNKKGAMYSENYSDYKALVEKINSSDNQTK
jgi:hypothetical protein